MIQRQTIPGKNRKKQVHFKTLECGHKDSGSFWNHLLNRQHKIWRVIEWTNENDCWSRERLIVSRWICWKQADGVASVYSSTVAILITVLKINDCSTAAIVSVFVLPKSVKGRTSQPQYTHVRKRMMTIIVLHRLVSSDDICSYFCISWLRLCSVHNRTWTILILDRAETARRRQGSWTNPSLVEQLSPTVSTS